MGSRVVEPLLPFLKWPGGKRWAAPVIAACVEANLKRTYYEPFLGGGAVFFWLRPRRVVLGDCNEDLINTYSAIRSDHRAVLRALRRLRVTQKEYYRIRGSRPRVMASRAARFLYLNRTAFGGIYRLNRDGYFNVPYGGGSRRPDVLWETDLLEKAEMALRTAQIRHADFEELIDQAGAGDVVYCDPTYTVAHDNNSFVRYNERSFSWSDQERLALSASRAAARGATVLVSNAHHRSVKNLYPNADVKTLSRISRVNPNPANRRDVSEYLFFIQRG